jgi:hypothetical protein
MPFGRLIRVQVHRSDPEAAIYVVAVPEAEKPLIFSRSLLRAHTTNMRT